MSLKDELGYKQNSPYNQEPFLNIKTTEGKITMSNVNKPLIGIDENGFMQIMQPNKDYQFTSKNVTEIPLYQNGGELTEEDYKAAINAGTIPSTMSFEVWKALPGNSGGAFDFNLMNSNGNGAPEPTDNTYSNQVNQFEFPTPPQPSNTIKVEDNTILPSPIDKTYDNQQGKIEFPNPYPTPVVNPNSGSNPVSNSNPSGNNGIDPSKDTFGQNPHDSKLLDYLMKSMPYTGSGLSLEDRFMTLGRSLNFNADSIQDPSMKKKAMNVNTGVGIAAGLSGLLGATRTTLSGAGYQNRMNNFYEQYFKDQRELQKSDYKFEDGGKFNMLDLSPEEIMLNNMIAALPAIMEDKANSEIEKDEFVIQADGVKLAVGDTHEKGGIKVILNEGDLVVSDNLVLGEHCKEIASNFGIKVTKNTTYAEAIQKYTDKIGLTKTDEELKDLLKQLNKTQNLEDSDTKRLNMMYLDEEIKEKQEERAILLQEQKTFAEQMYSSQEKKKDIPTYRQGGKYTEMLAKKHGLDISEVESIIQKYQDGGEQDSQPQTTNGKMSIDDLINQFAQMQGIDPNQIREQLSQMQPEEQQSMLTQMQQVVSGGGNGQQTFQDGGVAGVDKYVNDWNSFKPYEYSSTPTIEMKTRLKEFAKEWEADGYEAQIDKASSMSELNIIAGELQDKVKGSPQLATDYGSKAAPTKKGLQYLLDNKLVTAEDLTKAGVGVIKGKVSWGSQYKGVKTDEVKSLVNKVIENDPKIKQDYAVSNFADKEWYYRYPAKKQVEFTTKEGYDNFVKDKTKVEGDYYTMDNAPGLYIKPVLKEASSAPSVTPSVTPSVAPPNPGSGKIDPLNIKDGNQSLGWLLMPDSIDLPPDAVFPHVKREYRTTYNDPIAISPDQQLTEINRVQSAQNQALDYLPDNMRGAVNANNTALMLAEASKAISGANIFNAQNKQGVEQLNTQLDNQDESYRYNEVPRYEQLQLTALEKTRNDYYNYFENQTKKQLERLQFRNNTNLVDSMFDNVSYDIFGNPIVDKNSFTPFSTIPK